MSDLILHQFVFSHFNEKARWALALKGLPHERRTCLPGPHLGAIRRLSGQTQTPVLQANGEVVAGSAAILDWLEARYPDPPLLPADRDAAGKARELEARFDAEVGPAVRTVLFEALLETPGYIAATFSLGKPASRRLAYRCMMPLAKGMIAKGNGVADPDNRARCHTLTERSFEEIAARTNSGPFLAGDAFGIAALTAAALLAPLVQPGHPDITLPRPRPPAVEALLARWSAHPAAEWVRRTYRDHRPD